MAADVIKLITDDHRELESLFDRLRGDRQDRPRLLVTLRSLLIAHDRAEEECVYPVIAKTAPDERELVQRSKREHEEVERLLGQLDKCDPESKQFDQVLGKLTDALREHITEEEKQALPALRAAVDAEELQRLGERYQQRKNEEKPAKKLPAQDEAKRQAPTPASMAGNRRSPGTAR